MLLYVFKRKAINFFALNANLCKIYIFFQLKDIFYATFIYFMLYKVNFYGMHTGNAKVFLICTTILHRSYRTILCISRAIKKVVRHF